VHVCVALSPNPDPDPNPNPNRNPNPATTCRVGNVSGNDICTRVQQELASVLDKDKASACLNGVTINPHDSVKGFVGASTNQSIYQNVVAYAIFTHTYTHAHTHIHTHIIYDHERGWGSFSWP